MNYERHLRGKSFLKVKDGASDSIRIMAELFLELEGASQMYARNLQVLPFDTQNTSKRCSRIMHHAYHGQLHPAAFSKLNLLGLLLILFPHRCQSASTKP